VTSTEDVGRNEPHRVRSEVGVCMVSRCHGRIEGLGFDVGEGQFAHLIQHNADRGVSNLDSPTRRRLSFFRTASRSYSWS
jgi:hypothetical protein